MTETDSQDHDQRFARAMARARGYLAADPPSRRVWPVLAAASFFAVSSLIFATAAITAPPATLTHVSVAREAQ